MFFLFYLDIPTWWTTWSIPTWWTADAIPLKKQPIDFNSSILHNVKWGYLQAWDNSHLISTFHSPPDNCITSANTPSCSIHVTILHASLKKWILTSNVIQRLMSKWFRLSHQQETEWAIAIRKQSCIVEKLVFDHSVTRPRYNNSLEDALGKLPCRVDSLMVVSYFPGSNLGALSFASRIFMWMPSCVSSSFVNESTAWNVSCNAKTNNIVKKQLNPRGSFITLCRRLL